MGNFNGHLEHCLMFTLDEASWAGDKAAEGILKDLITGKEHIIERKGLEPYAVDNHTRVVIIGNEDWVVPASEDERRFAVFGVADGHKKDTKFFQAMREGMEAGGYRVLLRYLLDFDITGLDFNTAPSTRALADQKEHTLEPFQQWWRDCLESGEIRALDFDGWPLEIECERFRAAFRRYAQERNIRSRLPGFREIGRFIKKCAPGLVKKRMSGKDDRGVRLWAYSIPSISKAREEWDAFIDYKAVWDDTG